MLGYLISSHYTLSFLKCTLNVLSLKLKASFSPDNRNGYICSWFRGGGGSISFSFSFFFPLFSPLSPSKLDFQYFEWQPASIRRIYTKNVIFCSSLVRRMVCHTQRFSHLSERHTHTKNISFICYYLGHEHERFCQWFIHVGKAACRIWRHSASASVHAGPTLTRRCAPCRAVIIISIQYSILRQIYCVVCVVTTLAKRLTGKSKMTRKIPYFFYPG